MTNEEKATELASVESYGTRLKQHTYNTALQAMEWKDKQAAQEKQKWIDEACEWLFKNTRFTTNDIRDNGGIKLWK